MPGRRARAAGQDDQHVDVTPDDACVTPITPVEGGDLADLEEQDAEVRRAAASLEQRRKDLALRDELAAEGFDGLVWDRFADDLARYGHAVMRAWLRSGLIFIQCKKKNRPIGTAPSYWTEEDRYDLSTDSVVKGITTFRDKSLIGGLWTIDGGATLRTFFVGACVLVFPSIYRPWKTKREADLQLVRAGATDDDLTLLGAPLTGSLADPENAAVQWDQINLGMCGLPDARTQIAVMASSLGYTQDEIAALLSDPDKDKVKVSRGVIKQILHRHRSRLEKGTAHD